MWHLCIKAEGRARKKSDANSTRSNSGAHVVRIHLVERNIGTRLEMGRAASPVFTGFRADPISQHPAGVFRQLVLVVEIDPASSARFCVQRDQRQQLTRSKSHHAARNLFCEMIRIIGRSFLVITSYLEQICSH